MEELPICLSQGLWSRVVQHDDSDKLLVQTFPKSLTGATWIWFTKLDISKIKKWTNLAHVFVKQYKFNSAIAPNR